MGHHNPFDLGARSSQNDSTKPVSQVIAAKPPNLFAVELEDAVKFNQRENVAV